MKRSTSQLLVAAATKSQKAERTEVSRQENRSTRQKEDEISEHLATSLSEKKIQLVTL